MNKYTKLTLFFAPVGLVVTLYLSGVLYFIFNGANIGSVTPYTIIEQWWYYSSEPYYRDSLIRALLGGIAITIAASLFILVLNGLGKGKEKLHGEARWAKRSEIRNEYALTKKKNKDDGKGILIGRLGEHFLYYTGAAFVFLAAASRTGKGIGIIIPNLLRWFDSCVVTDFKKENFSITSKFRQQVLKQEVYLFNPFDEKGETHRYNPLAVVREGHLTVPDLLTICEMLLPTDSSDAVSKYFATSAQNLFLGLALYVKQTPSLPFTIGEIFRQSKGKGKSPKDHIETILYSRQDLSEQCKESLSDFLALDEEKGQSGVMNTMKTALIDWNNPVFDAATSECDFSFHDLRKKRMTIYLGITPDYIPVAGRILNLFFSQLININTKELPEQNKELKYKVLLLMDEFTAMGRSAIIAKSNNYFAGYGLQLLTIVQNPAQIEAKEPDGYGKDTAKTYIGNHEAQLLYTPEKEDAETISKFLGNKTVNTKTVQRNKGKRTTSTSETKRPLMLAQELREMPFKKMIIMMRGRKPIYCDKIHYFQEWPFIYHLKELSPTLGKIKGIPTKAQLDSVIADRELQIDLPTLALVKPTHTPIGFDSPLDMPLPVSDINPPVQNEDNKEEKVEATDEIYDLSQLETPYESSDIDIF